MHTGCYALANLISGIELRQGTNPLVVRNKIHDTKSAGVLVFNSAKGLLLYNDIYQNVLSGVDISRGIVITITPQCHNDTATIPPQHQPTTQHNITTTMCLYFLLDGNPVVRQNKIRNSVGHGLYMYPLCDVRDSKN